MPDNKTPKYQYDHYDFGDMLDSAVEAGSKIGSSVLGSIADADRKSTRLNSSHAR